MSKISNSNFGMDSKKTRKSILDLNGADARDFFLKGESYCKMDFPLYIGFDELILNVSKVLDGKKLSDFSSKPREHEDLNYTLLNNKDGRYAWRPFQLIHPALYVSLVHQLTEKDAWKFLCSRFQDFYSNKNIKCLSQPVVSLSKEKDKAEQVTNWWQEVEQRSIELSIEYEYLLETDIADCYGSIYTHSIPWALHTKEKAKIERKNKKLLGNIIDNCLQDMNHGQTNSIPQGSVLTDFIAEMVLGFADLELSKKIESANIIDYHILRYRDDYRIFVNNPMEGENIVKLLTEVLIDLGLKLNPEKTKISNDVIRSSIKSDKLAWVFRKKRIINYQKNLLIIHDHANKYPNSGSLIVALSYFFKRISKQEKFDNPTPLIAIVTDIALKSPRTYAICTAILSKLISFLNNDYERESILNKIKKRFDQIPNAGYMQIWIQRIAYFVSNDIIFNEEICKLILNENVSLWNCNWIDSVKLKKVINECNLVDHKNLSELNPVISIAEVELFVSNEYDGCEYNKIFMKL